MEFQSQGVFGNEIFEKRLKEFKWEKDDVEDSMIIYRAETSIPVVMHYEDQLQAERMVQEVKQFFHEWYTLAETTAFSLLGDIPLFLTPEYDNAAEKVGDLMLEVMTDPKYAEFLNEEYPDKKFAFGKKIINIEAGAGIFNNKPDGDRVLTYVGTARVLIQSSHDIYHYDLGDILKTVYN